MVNWQFMLRFLLRLGVSQKIRKILEDIQGCEGWTYRK